MAKYNWAPYQPATYCYGEARKGTIYLGVFLEDKFPSTYVGNIYSCRDIVGGSSLSHHAEGRADDHMVPQSKPADGISVGRKILELIGPHGKDLGIDHVIVNFAPWLSGRGDPRIFNATHPDGRVYKGEHPHKDHNHIGMTRWGATYMTLNKIKAIVGGMPPPPEPTGGDELLPLKSGERREDVRMLKDRLNETFNAGLDISGDNGDLYDADTVTAVKTHMGAWSGHPEAKVGRWVVANQWNRLEREWLAT